MITGLLLTSLLALTTWRPRPSSRSYFHFNLHVGVAPHGNPAALLTIVAAAKPSEESMKKTMTLKDVVEELGGAIKPHRIEYLLANHIVPEPERLGGRRVFTPKDVMRLAKHFGVKLPAAEAEPVGA